MYSFPQARVTVVRNMMHGPCGALDPNAVCMENGKCTKKYPHDFQPATAESDGSYPLYRRREGPTVEVNRKTLDNRYGVLCVSVLVSV